MSQIDRLKSLLQVYQYDKKIRLGEKQDGGYVFADLGNSNYDCYISAGVSNEESFSRDFIQQYKTKKETNYAFDGTIQDYPYHYTDQIQFIKKNIAPYNCDTTTDLKELLSTYHQIFLKMDIEGGEITWLLSLTEEHLRSCKQIVIEFHGITDDGWGSSLEEKIHCFEKLNKTHYIVHAHGNNFGHTVDGIPYVIELTYVNKNEFPYGPPSFNKTCLPISQLDYPNNGGRPDHDLKFYPFTHS
jgi:hypothetical protein